MDTHLVPCCLLDRGCKWTGTLDQLNTHLKDNCQYVDTKCPLNCLQTVPKNKVDQHVAQECSKRPPMHQPSSFKADFEQQHNNSKVEVLKYSLDVPRNDESGNGLEKAKICNEDVEQTLSDHKSDKALIENNLCDASKDKRSVDLEERLRKLELKVCEYEIKFQEVEKQKMKQVELNRMILSIMDEQEQEIMACDHQLKAVLEEKEEMAARLQTQDEQIERLLQFTSAKKSFVVKNMSTSVKRSGWKSRSTYLKMGGCKFGVAIDFTSDTDIRFSIVLYKGVFDPEIKWPCYLKFTMVLTNQKGGSDLSKCFLSNVEHGLFYKIMTMKQCEMEDYLRYDVLNFTILK